MDVYARTFLSHVDLYGCSSIGAILGWYGMYLDPTNAAIDFSRNAGRLSQFVSFLAAPTCGDRELFHMHVYWPLPTASGDRVWRGPYLQTLTWGLRDIRNHEIVDDELRSLLAACVESPQDDDLRDIVGDAIEERGDAYWAAEVRSYRHAPWLVNPDPLTRLWKFTERGKQEAPMILACLR